MHMIASIWLALVENRAALAPALARSVGSERVLPVVHYICDIREDWTVFLPIHEVRGCGEAQSRCRVVVPSISQIESPVDTNYPWILAAANVLVRLSSIENRVRIPGEVVAVS